MCDIPICKFDSSWLPRRKKTCKFPECTSAYWLPPKPNELNKHFFPLPKNPKQRELWLELTQLDNSIKDPRICEDHFEERHFVNISRHRLNCNAIPNRYIKGYSANPKPIQETAISKGSSNQPNIIISLLSKTPLDTSQSERIKILENCLINNTISNTFDHLLDHDYSKPGQINNLENCLVENTGSKTTDPLSDHEYSLPEQITTLENCPTNNSIDPVCVPENEETLPVQPSQAPVEGAMLLKIGATRKELSAREEQMYQIYRVTNSKVSKLRKVVREQKEKLKMYKKYITALETNLRNANKLNAINMGFKYVANPVTFNKNITKKITKRKKKKED